MDVITAINERTSVRGFKKEPVPKELIEQLLDAARKAPSASNQQPWNFVVITAGKQTAGQWENTGRTGGGVYITDGDRNSIAEAHWNSSFNINSTVYDNLQDANLSFCYNVSTYISVDAYSLGVSLINPSSTEMLSWVHTVSGVESWTCVSVNVTSNITEIGDYHIRLKHNSDCGNNKRL